ncbi:MAG TPA: hypothetical protein VFG83_08870 [Kofleriaceae bacterium]|nr:hypothetical protein [Kofleriaceae bacterium]
MLDVIDWIGSLKVREKSPSRVALSLSKTTRALGWAAVACGVVVAAQAWPISPYLAILPGLCVLAGAVIASLDRVLVFDRDAGVLRLEQRVIGLTSRQVVPLFHLRAVVVAARGGAGFSALGLGPRFVAYVERRVGAPIYLDEARRCAVLLRMAETIAEAADLRLEYDAAAN